MIKYFATLALCWSAVAATFPTNAPSTMMVGSGGNILNSISQITNAAGTWDFTTGSTSSVSRAGASETLLNKILVEPTITNSLGTNWSFSATTGNDTVSRRLDTALAALGNSLGLDSPPAGSLGRSEAAASSGTLRVCFWGDSITEGWHIPSVESSYPALVMAELQRVMPGVNIIWTNYSIGGRDLSRAAWSGYVAADPETNSAYNFYRPWGTVGKSWQDHIEDFEPDLVVLAFGMNIGTTAKGGSYYNATNLIALLDVMAAWTKAPDVVIVPTILPSATDLPVWFTQTKAETLTIQRAFREVARLNGLAVADAGRLFNVLRDGIDERRFRASVVNWWTFWPSGWSGDTNYATVDDQDLTTTGANKFLTLDANFYDGEIDFDIEFGGAGETRAVAVYYRKSTTYGYSAWVVTPGSGGSVALYYDSTVLSSMAASIPTNGCNVRIQASGAVHSIFIDNVLILSNTNYNCLAPGSIVLGGVPAITFESLYITSREPLNLGVQYDDETIFGSYDATDTGLVPSKSDGNGINHPTAFGLRHCYVRAFEPIIAELSKPRGYQNEFAVTTNAAPTYRTGGLHLHYTTAGLGSIESYSPTAGYGQLQLAGSTVLLKAGTTLAGLVTTNGVYTSGDSWHAPTFENGWTNYGGIYGDADYIRESATSVRLRGLIKGPDYGVAFILPTGYRPSQTSWHATTASAGHGNLTVLTSGAVTIVDGGTNYVSLDGIIFRTD